MKDATMPTAATPTVEHVARLTFAPTTKALLDASNATAEALIAEHEAGTPKTAVSLAAQQLLQAVSQVLAADQCRLKIERVADATRRGQAAEG